MLKLSLSGEKLVAFFMLDGFPFVLCCMLLCLGCTYARSGARGLLAK